MIICSRSRLPGISSISVVASMMMRPRPVVYVSKIPWCPRMLAAVGKSGPLTERINCSVVVSGLSISLTMASQISPRLWGGILVAIPTAMPDAPFISILGSRAGRTVGSPSESSKFGLKSTVFWSISAKSSSAMGARRASVYRMAAGGSPSMLPKLPCPVING